MAISIIIVYCDKDKKFIDTLVPTVKKNIHIPHEVILIDNTTDGIKPDVDYDKYYWMEGNKYALQGRKKGIQLAEGNYIWFLDADDSVLEFESFNYDEDVIIYQAINSKNKIITLHKKNEVISGHNNIFTWDNYLVYNVFLWNKIIKTSLLKEIEKIIPDDIYAVASEDKVYAVISLWMAKKIRYVTKPIYNYRIYASTSGSTVFTIEKFKHILFGFEKTEPLINSVIGKDAAIIRNDTQKGNARYFIDKISKAESTSCVKPMLDYLQNYISFEDIKKSWQEDYMCFYNNSVENYLELEKYLDSPKEYFMCIKHGKECLIEYDIKIIDGKLSYIPCD